ncbi:class I SAM-dependent methyltransferase [Aeromicrobium sp. CF4.19]|uniref:class I SAM-dependent methyltransferase n=1 Tax=Aeromicrobium sp. CF4.19 TaxID=3373082 RepID=UPI003EE545A3
MGGHYFDDDPTGIERRRDVDVDLWGHQLRCTTASGVFSSDGLDHATRLLLESGEPPAGTPTLLDLGCGWGPIACLLAAAAPDATVWAVDVNERARDLTALNARRHGLTVHVAAPEEVPGDVRFDAIWSNPPIRIGKPALHELLATWLGRLADDGHARLVVGKNLGADSLQRWLVEQGWPTQRAASSKGFRVLTSRPR